MGLLDKATRNRGLGPAAASTRGKLGSENPNLLSSMEGTRGCLPLLARMGSLMHRHPELPLALEHRTGLLIASSVQELPAEKAALQIDIDGGSGRIEGSWKAWGGDERPLSGIREELLAHRGKLQLSDPPVEVGKLRLPRSSRNGIEGGFAIAAIDETAFPPSASPTLFSTVGMSLLWASGIETAVGVDVRLARAGGILVAVFSPPWPWIGQALGAQLDQALGVLLSPFIGAPLPPSRILLLPDGEEPAAARIEREIAREMARI